MREVDRVFNSMVGANNPPDICAVQAFDSTAENYNPPLVDVLNVWLGVSKSYYTVSEVETFKSFPGRSVAKPQDYGLKSLDELRYFNGLTSMPSRYGWSSGIESVIYPDSITNVSDQSWIICSTLIYFEIGNAVVTIQPYIFQTSTAPKTFVCRTPTPPVWVGTNGYSTAQRAICDLFVPAESIALYQQASVWNEFKSINAIDPSKKKQSL